MIRSTVNTAALTQSLTTDYVGNIIYEINALKRILVDGGYYESGNYYFYINDHLGNNRIVTDAAAAVVQSTQYYPFGASFADASGTSTQPYKYNGKELDTKNGLNLYDYSARYYESAIGRFTTVDPHAENYYSISPYAYVKNNPINAIDPDGKLVIFINGMHNRQSTKDPLVQPKYWITAGEFDLKVMRHLNDFNHLYYDGSSGGFDGSVFNLSAGYRYKKGYEMGLKEAVRILRSLGPKETIKFITHSMGGAYAKGFIKALQEYMLENGYDPSIIEFEADFAPYQPKDQQAVDGVKTYQFSHSEDWVAGNDEMQGAEYKDTSSDKDQGHRIGTFLDQIMNLPAGNYKVVNGEIVKK